MKTFIATLLVLFLSLPLAHADEELGTAFCEGGYSVDGLCFKPSGTPETPEGDVDGRALSCKQIYSSTYRYFIFENGRVYEVFVTDEIPLRIQNTETTKYISSVGTIEWDLWYSTSSGVYTHVLDRKTLLMVRSNNSTKMFTPQDHLCGVGTPDQIIGILNQKIETLKERMKDNKL